MNTGYYMLGLATKFCMETKQFIVIYKLDMYQ